MAKLTTSKQLRCATTFCLWWYLPFGDFNAIYHIIFCSTTFLNLLKWSQFTGTQFIPLIEAGAHDHVRGSTCHLGAFRQRRTAWQWLLAQRGAAQFPKRSNDTETNDGADIPGVCERSDRSARCLARDAGGRRGVTRADTGAGGRERGVRSVISPLSGRGGQKWRLEMSVWYRNENFSCCGSNHGWVVVYFYEKGTTCVFSILSFNCL